jgi:hypothetical protein
MRIRRPLQALGGIVLALVLVEAAVRLRQWYRYGTMVSSFYHLERDPVSGLEIPRPNEEIGPIRINSLGFRGPELERPKPARRVRIGFLGGSTTFCAEASSLEATWPDRVVAGLRAAAPDLEFDYVNGASAGFSTAELLENLEHRVGPLEPDVLVLYEATNDLVQDSRRLAIRQGIYAREEARHSPLGDYWLTYYLLEKNLRQLARSREQDRARLAFEPAELSAPFRERLSELVAAARRRAPLVALVTFSTRLRADQPPGEQRAAAAGARYYVPFLSVEDLLAGYAEYNRVIRVVAADTGALLIEGEHTIPGDARHFADTVHFLDPGLLLQAERVLAGLLAAPEYQALLARKRALPRG